MFTLHLLKGDTPQEQAWFIKGAYPHLSAGRMRAALAAVHPDFSAAEIDRLFTEPNANFSPAYMAFCAAHGLNADSLAHTYGNNVSRAVAYVALFKARGECEEEAAWLEQNASKPVLWAPTFDGHNRTSPLTFLAFFDIVEAVHFKLRWIG